MKRFAVLAAACLLSCLASQAPAWPHPADAAAAPAPQSSSQVLFVFDLQAMSAGSLLRSRAAVEAFVRGELPDGMAIGIVSGDRIVGGRLTSNPTDLLAAVASMRVSNDLLAQPGAIPLDRSDDRAAELAATLDAANRPVGDPAMRSRRTLATLAALTKTLTPLPGGKTIVWISDAFSAPSAEREKAGGQDAQVKALLAAAATASLRLVAMNARGGSAALARDDLWSGLLAGTGGTLVTSERELAAALRNAVAEATGKPDASPAPAGRTVAEIAPLSPVPTAAAPVASPAPPAAAAPAVVPAPATPAPTSPASTSAPRPTAAPAPAEGAARMTPTHAADAATLRETAPGDAAMLPAELQAQARTGWDAYQAGDTKAARGALLAAAGHPAAPPWVRYVLGWAEFAEGNIDAARAQWTSVRKQVPDFQRVYFDLADCSLRQQQPGDALSILNDAAKRWPKSAEVLNATGALHSGAGRLKEALEAFEGAVEQEPQDTTAHFNIARTLELRYFRDAQPVQGSTGKPNPADLNRAASEYRRVIELKGAEAQEAAEGLRRTSELDAKALRLQAPMLVGSYGNSALGGFPIRLAWSADGTYLCIGALQIDNRGNIVARQVRVVTVWSGELNSAPAVPGWAESYWAWKSAPNAPWYPSPKIESARRRSFSMYTMGAPSSTFVTTLQLGSEVVGESTEKIPFGPGTSYSWSPYAMGALAYVDRRGVLAVIDRNGRKVDLVGARGGILLPAWSPDGTSIAFLETSSNGFDLKVVDVYPKK